MADEAAAADRLAAARTYGARMASVDPLPWTADEFLQVLVEEHPNDPAYVDAAWQAFVAAAGPSADPPPPEPQASTQTAPGEPAPPLPPVGAESDGEDGPLQLFSMA